MKTLSVMLAVALYLSVVNMNTESSGYDRFAAKKLGQNRLFTHVYLKIEGLN